MFPLFHREKTAPMPFDSSRQRAVLRCSICTGEQVACFQDLATGKLTEICLIRSDGELQEFMRQYGVETITKVY